MKRDPKAGIDGSIGTPDDRILLSGGGSDGRFAGGELASPSAEVFIPPGADSTRAGDDDEDGRDDTRELGGMVPLQKQARDSKRNFFAYDVELLAGNRERAREKATKPNQDTALRELGDRLADRANVTRFARITPPALQRKTEGFSDDPAFGSTFRDARTSRRREESVLSITKNELEKAPAVDFDDDGVADFALSSPSDQNGGKSSSPERDGLTLRGLNFSSGLETARIDFDRKSDAPTAPLDKLFAKRQGGQQATPSAAENTLRAYTYYRALDEKLTLGAYSAQKAAGQTLEVPRPAVGDEGLGRDGFRALYGVNPFVATSRDAQSTFSMDVDTASFTRTRDVLRTGKLPEAKSVRVEEFVNYFPDNCPPDGEAAFSVCALGGPAPFGGGLDLIKITVKARELRPSERRRAVLTLAVDTSGSMHTGRGLALMRRSLKELTQALGPDDQVALVAYSAQAYVVLPHTPARERQRLDSAIDGLIARGGTNVEGGLDLAYRLADEVLDPKALNRVVLCSDGVANIGARKPEDVLHKVKVFARRGIYLSVVGFGAKRYNDDFLERLTGEGNGNYTYVANVGEARRVFRDNLPATLQVLAEDAKIQVEFDPDVVAHYRLLGYENRDIADEDFRNDKIDAAEVGPGTTVTALYELERRPGAHGALGEVFVRFRDAFTRQIDEQSFPLPPGVLATAFDAAEDTFLFTACVAETAELLRGSYWARDGSFADVLGVLARLSPAFRSQPQWGELVEIVTRSQAATIRRLATGTK